MTSYTDATLDYFAAHAISPAVAAEVGVLESDGALGYPYSDADGAYIRVRPIAGPAKVKQPAGRALACWWPAGRPEQLGAVLVCEGESDTLAALSAIRREQTHPAARAILGELTVLGVPGASFPADRLAEALKGAESVILAGDGDEAGQAFVRRARQALEGRAGVVQIELGNGRDLADTLAASSDGAAWLAGVIADADSGSPALSDESESVIHRLGQSGRLTVRAADLSRSKPPEWAWTYRIVLGALNLIVGQEGAGKGTLAAWVFAKLSRGELPGDLYGTPVSVAVVGDEDGFDEVWTPRLEAAGADIDRIKLIERRDGGLIELASDREELSKIVEAEGVRLLYLDQLTDNLGAAVDDWKAKQVRQALAPARQLARELDCAVLGSLHPNKSGVTFRQLMSGSVQFNALSRSSLLLAEHPEDPDRRVLVRAKGNLSKAPEAVEFDIAGHVFGANGHSFNVPKVVALATSELTVDDLLGRAAAPAGEARTDARTIIGHWLANGDWQEASKIIEDCEAKGIYKRAAQRAANDIGIDKSKRGFPASAYWRLRGHTDDTLTDVASVASVASENLALNGRNDRGDIKDREDTPRGVTSVVASGNHRSEIRRIGAITDPVIAEQEWARLQDQVVA